MALLFRYFPLLFSCPPDRPPVRRLGVYSLLFSPATLKILQCLTVQVNCLYRCGFPVTASRNNCQSYCPQYSPTIAPCIPKTHNPLAFRLPLLFQPCISKVAISKVAISCFGYRVTYCSLVILVRHTPASHYPVPVPGVR